MTNREFYTAIINGEINDDVLAMAKAEIEKLNARNEKRRNTPTKEQEANEERKALILDFLTGQQISKIPYTLAADIATACGFSTQRVSALCKQLVDNGDVKVEDVKVKGKGTLKAYSLAE